MRGRPGGKGQRRPRAQQCAAYGIADQIEALQHAAHCKARGQGDNHAQRRPPGHADGDQDQERQPLGETAEGDSINGHAGMVTAIAHHSNLQRGARQWGSNRHCH